MQVPPKVSTANNEVQLQMLSPDSWAALIQSWLAQGCLSVFGPQLTDGFKLTPDVLAEHVALPSSLPQQPSKSQLPSALARTPLSAQPKAFWLAQTAKDITVQPAVTDKQRQVQEQRIQDVLQRYALYPQVRLSDSDSSCSMLIRAPQAAVHHLSPSCPSWLPWILFRC